MLTIFALLIGTTSGTPIGQVYYNLPACIEALREVLLNIPDDVDAMCVEVRVPIMRRRV